MPLIFRYFKNIDRFFNRGEKRDISQISNRSPFNRSLIWKRAFGSYSAYEKLTEISCFRRKLRFAPRTPVNRSKTHELPVDVTSKFDLRDLLALALETLEVLQTDDERHPRSSAEPQLRESPDGHRCASNSWRWHEFSYRWRYRLLRLLVPFSRHSLFVDAATGSRIAVDRKSADRSTAEVPPSPYLRYRRPDGPRVESARSRRRWSSLQIAEAANESRTASSFSHLPAREATRRRSTWSRRDGARSCLLGRLPVDCHREFARQTTPRRYRDDRRTRPSDVSYGLPVFAATRSESSRYTGVPLIGNVLRLVLESLIEREAFANFWTWRETGNNKARPERNPDCGTRLVANEWRYIQEDFYYRKEDV